MHRLSASRRPPRVSRSTRSIAARAPGASRARSPSTCTTTPWSRSSAASLAMYSSSRLMSAEISVGGRCQFSSENANNVSTSTPASMAPSTISRPAAVAIHDDGDVAGRGSVQADLPEQLVGHLDLHDVRFLRLDRGVHELQVVVVQLLHVLL